MHDGTHMMCPHKRNHHILCVCALTAKLECNSLSPSFPHVRSLLTYDDIIHLALNSGFANGRSINTIGEYNNKEEKHVPSGVVRLLNNIDEITKFTEDNFICFMSHQCVACFTSLRAYDKPWIVN